MYSLNSCKIKEWLDARSGEKQKESENKCSHLVASVNFCVMPVTPSQRPVVLRRPFGECGSLHAVVTAVKLHGLVGGDAIQSGPLSWYPPLGYVRRAHLLVSISQVLLVKWTIELHNLLDSFLKDN